MARYKQLSIPPNKFKPIEELTRRYNEKYDTDLKPPKIVVMAARRMLENFDKETGEASDD